MGTTIQSLKNPYLDAYFHYMRRDDDEILGPWVPLDDGIDTNHHLVRTWLTLYCAWAVPNDAAIQAIADLDQPIVEIGAGNGYWAWMLDQAGVHIEAFDLDPYDNDWCERCEWFTVRKGSPVVLKQPKYVNYALFLCWPFMNAMAMTCLKWFKGDTLIYIGEWSGGCNANEKFFKALEKEWSIGKEVEIPQWYGLHDYMTILKKS